MKIRFITAVLFLLATSIGQAFAGTATGSTKATAKIASSCQLSTNNINWGVLTPGTSGAAATTGTLGIQCTRSTTYSIVLSMGANTDGTYRLLKGSSTGASMVYSLCQTAGWINTNVSSCNTGYWKSGYPKTGTGTGASQSIPIYAYIPYGYYTPDSYSDTVTVTTTF